MQQQVSFGHRVSAPGGAFESFTPTPQFACSSLALPITIRKEIGLPVMPVLGVSWFVVLTRILLPVLLSPRTAVDSLLHGSALAITLVVFGLVGVLIFFGRRKGVLAISADGIAVQSNADRYFYAWTDIDHGVETGAGVRLVLKGRSEAQNAYNVITSRFGLTPAQLSTIVRDGVAIYGTDRRTSLSRTIAPGDDVKRAQIASVKLLASLFGAIFVLLFGALVIWQGSTCLRSLELQKNGVRTDAQILRFYSGGCGRGGCTINVEYVFTPGADWSSAAKPIHGYAFIGSRENDPDILTARSLGTVPIVYDRLNPKVSDLNLNDWVFAKNPFKMFFELLGIAGAALLVPLLVMGALLAPALMMDRKAAA